MSIYAVFSLLLIVLLAACSRSGPADTHAAGMPAVAVRAVPAALADVPLEIAAIGNVEAVSTVDVKARVTGPVVKVHFQEGQDVRAGTLLFELDSEPYLRQISELEANLVRDAANERQARANIAKDQATLKNAQSIAERGTKLAAEGIFSREQREQVTSSADSARAALEADQAAAESAQALSKADAARLTQTKLLLGYTRIVAPISGRAGSIAVREGNVVKENDTPMVTLLQISPVNVSFSVPEGLLTDVRERMARQKVEVSAMAADNFVSTGTLSFIDNSVDTTTGTIKLKATFENSQRHLWPGQFVKVKAQIETERGRILVPARAVQTGPNGKYVWVMGPDSTVAMRLVRVLRNQPDSRGVEAAVIASGLNSGERVISEGQLRLTAGAPVRLLDPVKTAQ